jgi:hypothetical protein
MTLKFGGAQTFLRDTLITKGCLSTHDPKLAISDTQTLVFGPQRRLAHSICRKKKGEKSGIKKKRSELIVGANEAIPAEEARTNEAVSVEKVRPNEGGPCPCSNIPAYTSSRQDLIRCPDLFPLMSIHHLVFLPDLLLLIYCR